MNQEEYYNCHKLKFIPKDANFDEHIELVNRFIGALIENGQIVKETDSNIFFTDNEVFCYVTLFEESALNEKNNNILVNDSFKEMQQHFEFSYEKIGKNWEYEGYVCSCDANWYILMHEWQFKESPIVCGDCDGSIPLYRLPKILGSEGYYSTLRWYDDYEAIVTLWISGLSDRFAYKQMNDPNSQLAKDGREICREFEQATGKPFYYKLFYDDVMHKKPTPKECPVCKENWEVSSEDLIVDFKCDKCRLVASKNKWNKQ